MTTVMMTSKRLTASHEVHDVGDHCPDCQYLSGFHSRRSLSMVCAGTQVTSLTEGLRCLLSPCRWAVARMLAQARFLRVGQCHERVRASHDATELIGDCSTGFRSSVSLFTWSHFRNTQNRAGSIQKSQRTQQFGLRTPLDPGKHLKRP